MTKDELLKDVYSLQRVLKVDGLYAGKIDGIEGPLTRAGRAIWEKRMADAAARWPLDARSEGVLAACSVRLNEAVRPWLVQKVLPWAKGRGYAVKVIQGLRSWAEQNSLSAAVTNAKGGKSFHNYGAAIDLGIFDLSLPPARQYDGVPDRAYDSLHAVCGKPAGTIWGGDFKSLHDAPHYQLSDWGSSISPLIAYMNK